MLSIFESLKYSAVETPRASKLQGAIAGRALYDGLYREGNSLTVPR